MASKLLRNHSRQVFDATKNGWDGTHSSGDQFGDRQWSFPGSLLFAITVITTIGNNRHCLPRSALWPDTPSTLFTRKHFCPEFQNGDSD